MLAEFERDYAELVAKVLQRGERRQTRNAKTRSLFAQRLIVDMSDGLFFPIIQARKMFYKGVFGELSAMLHAGEIPLEHIDQFKELGCNYWDKWANVLGYINIDYGNAWFEGGQIEHLKHCLANNTTDRRMLINGWRPERLKDLSLPCCHYSYQFYVTADRRLHMLWNQRSVDVMVGLPSDIIFAAAWLIMIANEFNMTPGIITMDFGDTHIYEGHTENAYAYLARCRKIDEQSQLNLPRYATKCEPGKDFTQFTPSDIVIEGYESLDKLEFELYE